MWISPRLFRPSVLNRQIYHQDLSWFRPTTVSEWLTTLPVSNIVPHISSCALFILEMRCAVFSRFKISVRSMPGMKRVMPGMTRINCLKLKLIPCHRGRICSTSRFICHRKQGFNYYTSQNFRVLQRKKVTCPFMLIILRAYSMLITPWGGEY